MKLLLDERKLIIAIGNNIEYGVWGNLKSGSASWRITPTYYMMDGNYILEDIGDIEVPTYVKEGQYYYIDGEFRLVDECPNEYRDRIVELEVALTATDEIAIELYEKQLVQEEINATQEEINMAYDESLIELYELLG